MKNYNDFINEDISNYLQPKSEDDIKNVTYGPLHRRALVLQGELPSKYMPSDEEIEKSMDEEFKFGLTFRDIMKLSKLSVGDLLIDWNRYNYKLLGIGYIEKEFEGRVGISKYIYREIPRPNADYTSYSKSEITFFCLFDDAAIIVASFQEGKKTTHPIRNSLKVYEILQKKFKI